MKKLIAGFLIAVAFGFFNSAWSTDETLRFAITGAVASDPSYVHYRELTEYVAKKTGRSSVFISDLSYNQVDNLFTEGEVDVGFLCNCHYARREEAVGFEAIAAPVIAGYAGPRFRIYIIVPKESPAVTLADLKGLTVDFADPLSTTTVYGAYMLWKQNQTIKKFFNKAIYSGSHDMTIELVAKGMVDAGFIDGHIWDYHRKLSNDLSSGTKVIHRSGEFTAPPVVVSKNLPDSVKKKIRQTVLSMHKDARGRELLRRLNIERFASVRKRDYQDVKRMYGIVENDI